MFKVYSNFIGANQFEEVLTEELKEKPITVFNDYTNITYEQLKFNDINILMVMEPNQLFGIHDWAIQNANNFSVILTWSQEILDKCDNSMFFPFGISWLDKEYVKNINQIGKRFEVSFLCGAKQMIEGHHLRHRLYKRDDEITIPKQWYYTLPDYKFNEGHHTIIQYDGQSLGSEKKKLWESMFSICVENSSNRSYHTEKIIDAFLSKTIPIYWGCPNLEELGYDPRGFIYCTNEDEIIEAVNKLTPEFYTQNMEAINYNYTVALYYANLFGRFREAILDIIDINKLQDRVLTYDKLFAKYKGKHTTFIETGTHKGDGVQRALDVGFNKVISVEILPEFYTQCVERFKGNENVYLYLGDSNDKLAEMLIGNEASLIFLDGHFHNGDPLKGELEILKNQPINTHTIIVDDMPNYFGDGQEVKAKILEINPNYQFAWEDSYNEGTGKIHKNHNLIAYLNE